MLNGHKTRCATVRQLLTHFTHSFVPLSGIASLQLTMRVAKKNPYAHPDYAADQWSNISSSDGSKSVYGRVLLGGDDDSLVITSDEESGSNYESDTEDEGSRDGVSDIMNEAQKVIQESKTNNLRLVVHDPPIYENTANETARATHDQRSTAQKETKPNDEQIITLAHTPWKEHDEVDKDSEIQVEEQAHPPPARPRKQGFFRLRRLARRIGRMSSAHSTKSEETEDTSDVEEEPTEAGYQDISVEVADDGTPLKANKKPIEDFVFPAKEPEPDPVEISKMGEGGVDDPFGDDKSTAGISADYKIELEDVGLNSYDTPAEPQKRKLRRRLSLRKHSADDGGDSDNSASSRKSVASRISTVSRRSLASIRSRLSFRRKNTDYANADLDDEVSKGERKRRFFVSASLFPS
jgi:hypothetical protein